MPLYLSLKVLNYSRSLLSKLKSKPNNKIKQSTTRSTIKNITRIKNLSQTATHTNARRVRLLIHGMYQPCQSLTTDLIPMLCLKKNRKKNLFQLALPTNARKERLLMNGMFQPCQNQTTENTPMPMLNKNLCQLALQSNAKKERLLIHGMSQPCQTLIMVRIDMQ